MDSPARILIADDDSTFLNSTAALIRREGYHCDCAGDSGTALSMLDQDEFDLLLADINMPGNPCLEMVERVAHTRPGLPVILLTGYPTLDSALRSRELPVIAYLLKPAPFGEMLRWVEQGLFERRSRQALGALRTRLCDWDRELALLAPAVAQPVGGAAPVSATEFFDLCLRNLTTILLDLRNLLHSSLAKEDSRAVCQLLACRRLDSLSSALQDSVNVLERTKSAFKSKDLGALRQRLEALLRDLNEAVAE